MSRVYSVTRLVRCTLGQLWHTNFVLFFYPFFSFFFFEPARLFPDTVHGIVFSDCSSRQCSCFLEEYPGWSSFRDGRVGMWTFSERGCASQTCELCVSEMADIFTTRLFIKLITLKEISGVIYKINMLFKIGCDSRTLTVTTLKIDDPKFRVHTVTTCIMKESNY